MILIQGNLTVSKYKKRYTELAKYALDFVTNETDKCKQFEEGLRTKIKAPVIAS